MTLSATSAAILPGLSNDLAAAVERVGRSVVAVNGRRRFPASGLAWTADLVLTAAHVLERDADLTITTPSGQSAAAHLVARDGGSDLAMLSVPNAALEPVVRAVAGTRLAAGHLVLAVGRPGTPEPVASFGAVSSVGGAWRTAQGAVLDAYIRADVALLPGLSGGALADVQGDLVGLLSAHLAGSDPVAIPTATLDALVQRMRTGGSSRRAYLGVSTQPVDLQDSLRDRLQLNQASGLMLLGLEPGAPAECDGLMLGDIILAIGGRTVEDGEALHMALGPEIVNRPCPIRLIRAGAVKHLTVTPAARPN